MTDAYPPGSIDALSAAYAEYCVRVGRALERQASTIDALGGAMASANAIHCYGFGRSAHAAASLAIRLRHFQRKMPDTWWANDQVRNPFRAGDLLISFSREGKRFELLEYVRHARELGVVCAFVTADPVVRGGEGFLVRDGDLAIGLPAMADPKPEFLYGGGDFELAAYFFQEVLSARIGCRFGLTDNDVKKNHVH
ncbi:MAG: SIS domain-containing protein [Methanospirillum sp.]|mgnify:CR=1 FL=1|nr:SIS domain-containing protein [Methanospirillum sp.]